MQATVKWFNPDKNHGFLIDDQGEEFMVHVREVKSMPLPKSGDTVTFEPVAGPPGKERRAVNVTVVARAETSTRPGAQRVRDDKVQCANAECGKWMVPRMEYSQGNLLYSFCPFCTSIYKDFRKSGCFIATAVYDDPKAPQVHVLRTWRDQSLLPTRSGRAFVRVYYRYSPPIANWLREHPSSARVVRAALDQVVRRTSRH
jgi:cold shock CspA family protein